MKRKAKIYKGKRVVIGNKNLVTKNEIHVNDIPQEDGESGGGVTIKNQTKSVTIAENGNTVVSYDSGYTGLEKVSVKVAIPNEEKTVNITENGTTEVVATKGFLSKVIVNTNVASGGGGGSDIPVIGDGKTYLYIKIAEKGRMNVPLYFSQTVANGVTIDWGDGSTPQTLSGTGYVNTTHTYSDVGKYVISLNPVNGCTLELGSRFYDYCVMGSTKTVYCNMLQAVEIGNSVTSIKRETFSYCYSLANIVIPENVTSIGNSAFYNCYSLASIVIPNSVTSIDMNAFYSCYSLANIVIPDNVINIGNSAFYHCRSLASVVIPQGATSISSSMFYGCASLSSIVIPESVTSIGDSAFRNCENMAFYDFSQCASIPTLGGTSVFSSTSSDCKIVVPDSLYDTWIAATNWSSHASKIIKASEFNA